MAIHTRSVRTEKRQRALAASERPQKLVRRCRGGTTGAPSTRDPVRSGAVRFMDATARASRRSSASSRRSQPDEARCACSASTSIETTRREASDQPRPWKLRSQELSAMRTSCTRSSYGVSPESRSRDRLHPPARLGIEDAKRSRSRSFEECKQKVAIARATYRPMLLLLRRADDGPDIEASGRSDVRPRSARRATRHPADDDDLDEAARLADRIGIRTRVASSRGSAEELRPATEAERSRRLHDTHGKASREAMKRRGPSHEHRNGSPFDSTVRPKARLGAGCREEIEPETLSRCMTSALLTCRASRGDADAHKGYGSPSAACSADEAQSCPTRWESTSAAE